MSDITTLLRDAAPGAPLTADPVAAVHARVRRRANRHRTAVATGATFAVAATGVLAVSRDAAPVRITTSPSASTAPGAYDTSWRAPRNPFITYRNEPLAAEFDRLADVITSNPDVFLGLIEEATNTDRGYQFTIVLGADYAKHGWKAMVEEFSTTFPLATKTCALTIAEYDRIAAEVAAADWPAGDVPTHGPVPLALTFLEHCQIEVGMTANGPNPADVAYAKARWGDTVRLVVARPTPEPNPTS